MKSLIHIAIPFIFFFSSQKTFAKKQLIKFDSDTIYQYATAMFLVEFPKDDSSRYELNSDVGKIHEWVGGYYFSTSHIGKCKIYLKDLKKNKIIYYVYLTSIKLPPLISSLGNLFSGKIQLGHLALNSHISTWFKPNRHVHLCEHELMLRVKSYTMYCLKKDTFYKINANSSIKQKPPNGFEKGDIIIIDNIKTPVGVYDTLVETSPIILAVSPQQIYDFKPCLLNENTTHDFDSIYYVANYCLQKKKLDSGYILRFCTKDSSNELIFEEQFINGESKYRYCKPIAYKTEGNKIEKYTFEKREPTISYGYATYGAKMSGNITLNELRWANGVYYNIPTGLCNNSNLVLSYTAYVFRKDTFFKHYFSKNLLSSRLDNLKQEAEIGDIIIIDDIICKKSGYNTIVKGKPIILKVDSSGNGFFRDNSALDSPFHFDYDFNCFAGNCHLYKKSNGSGFIIQLITNEPSPRIIFEERVVHSKATYKYQPLKKYIPPAILDTTELINFMKWDLATQWDSSFTESRHLNSKIGRYNNNDLKDELKKYFNVKECENLKNQNRNIDDQKWDHHFIPNNIILIDNTFDPEDPFYVNPANSENNYLLPLITADKKFVIVKKYTVEKSHIYIYQKVNSNTWKLYTKIK